MATNRTAKRPRGRPPQSEEDKFVLVHVRFPPDILEHIDRRAKRRGLTRSAFLRTLAVDDLEQHGGMAAQLSQQNLTP